MSYIKGKGGIQTDSTKNDGAGISTESQMDEKLHRKIVTEAVDKVFGFNRKGWTFKTSEKLIWLTKKAWGWGVTKTGKSTRLDADGYFIYYNNKLGGQTGGTIELLLDLGVTIETNPTSEELENSLCGWMNSLIDKYEN